MQRLLYGQVTTSSVQRTKADRSNQPSDDRWEMAIAAIFQCSDLFEAGILRAYCALTTRDCSSVHGVLPPSPASMQSLSLSLL